MEDIRDTVYRILVKYSENIAEVGLFLSGCTFFLGFFVDKVWYLVCLAVIIITTALYFKGQKGV